MSAFGVARRSPGLPGPMGGWRSRALLATAATVCFAGPLAAQEDLERWLEDLVPRTFGAPGPVRPGGSFTPLRIDPVPATTISGALLAHRSGLGPWALERGGATVGAGQPLGSPDLTLDVRAEHRLGSGLDLGNGDIRRAVASRLDAGLTGRWDGGPGRWALRLGGRWSGGSGWSASVGSASGVHRLVVTRAEGGDADLRLTLPADDVQGRTSTAWSRSAVTGEIRWPRGLLAGAALAVDWSRETFDPRGDGGGATLEAVVGGVRDERGVELRVPLPEALLLSVAAERSRVGADGALARSGQRAGRLFFGNLRSERWGLAVADPADAGGWRTAVEWGRGDGSLSARLETWPFRQVWDQLGAIAYRVRGDLGTRWTAWTFARRSGTGRGWAVGVRRLQLVLDGEDWLVTGLGFGRSDRRTLEDLRATVVLLGGGLDLAVPGTGDRATLSVRGSIPVLGSWNEAMREGLSGSDWLDGGSRWSSVTLALSWSGAPQ
ncbi:MAG: hypothetical protein PVI57_01330 [Gemmatimonadota bacterium]